MHLSPQWMVFGNVVLRWIGDVFGAAGMASPLPDGIRSICRRRAVLYRVRSLRLNFQLVATFQIENLAGLIRGRDL